MIVYIIAALLVFGILIAVHELGHFLAAKACGVRVNEFSIGMGPALWKKQKGETQYSLRLFPVGGFCAMEGEEEDSDDPTALNNQGFWAKLLIFAAGAAMNFIAGLLIILVLYADAQAFYVPVVAGFADGCPLESADGLQEGDRLLRIDGEKVYVYSDISLLMGLSVGASVAVARSAGAGDRDGVHRAVHTSMALAVLSGAALGVLLLVLSRPLLEMMGCPADVVGGAQLYLNIYAVGLPASLVYNYGAAILRAVGDTKRPLYYLTVSGLVNVVLNVALVAGLRLGVAGVAIATVVSEAISAALVLASLIASHGDVRFEPKKTRIERRSLSTILRIGIPAGLQSSMFSISNVLIQSAINSFGAAAIAGNTAAASIEGFATTVSNSISQAALTFSSQNMGAEKYARVRRVLRVCLAATFVGGLTLGLLIYTFGTPLLALFNTDPAVIASGLVRVRHNMPLYVLFCMQDTFVGQLRGVGYSLLPTITSLSGICLLRVVWLYTAFAASPTLDTLYLSYPVSWAATLFALVVCYAVVVRKMPRA